MTETLQHKGQCNQLLPCLQYILYMCPFLIKAECVSLYQFIQSVKLFHFNVKAKFFYTCCSSREISTVDEGEAETLFGPACGQPGSGWFLGTLIWGAAHTQECRWVERGPDTHACEVSFHPLADIQWGGQHQTNEGAK